MITQQTYREIFEMGVQYAMNQHERTSGGLFSDGSCEFRHTDGCTFRDKVARNYEKFMSQHTIGDSFFDTRVYAFQSAPNHPPGIRAFTPMTGGYDEAVRMLAPAGIHVTPLGTLGDVLKNPDRKLPEPYIDWLTDTAPPHRSDTIYDRLEPAEDFDADIPQDITLTFDGEEFEVTDFDYEMERDGTTVKLRPERMVLENTMEVEVEF